MSELCDLTGAELSSRLAAGETTAVEIVESSQARVDAVDAQVGAFLTLTPQLARERAEELDVYLSTGAPQSAAAGIPVASRRPGRGNCSAGIVRSIWASGRLDFAVAVAR